MITDEVKKTDMNEKANLDWEEEYINYCTILKKGIHDNCISIT